MNRHSILPTINTPLPPTSNMIGHKGYGLLMVVFLSILYRRGSCEVVSAELTHSGFCSNSQPTETSNCDGAKMASNPRRERTYIMVKPDGVQRGLVGEIIKRFEQKGFKLVALKFQWASEELLKKHYAAHLEQPFFPGLLKYIMSGPVVPMVWEGGNVIKTARQMVGATNPSSASPGTIRGDYCIQTGRNAIHGSDSLDSANTEISLWFTDEELVDWKSNQEPMIYE